MEDLIVTDKLLLLIKEFYPATDKVAHVDNIKKHFKSMSLEQQVQFMKAVKTTLEGNSPIDDEKFIGIMFELEEQQKSYVLQMIDNIVDELEKPL